MNSDILGSSSATPAFTPPAEADNSLAGAAANGSDVCDHCGLPAPPRKSNELTFCCSGCRGAYHLIHQWGLEDYYALRDRLMDQQSAEPVADKQVASESWDDLDSAGLLGASTPQEIGDGLVCSRLAIAGVHCGACVWLIERMAILEPGWQSARVGMHDHSLEVTFDPTVTKLSKIAECLSKIGYRVFPWVEGSQVERFRQENRQRLVQIAIAGFCAMNAMWLAVAIYAGEYSGIAHSHITLLRAAGVMLGMVAAFVPGRTFFQGAFGAIRTRTPHMDIPIALGIGVGAIAGVVSLLADHADVYFDSVAVLVFFLLVGRWIQFRQQHRAADAVSLLMRMTPSIAVAVLPDGSHRKVPTSSLQIGDRFYVVAGESVAVDGMIVKGITSIDRSLMTGESLPVTLRDGDAVEAGALNLQSPITIEATATRDQSRITKLMKLVEEASLTRTPIVQLADAIAGRFVVALLGLAALTMVLWWSTDPMKAASHTVALLIVACPCALALATPLAIAVSLGRAAKRKLLIRSGETLERLSKPGIIWFDKTGTLTNGRPELMSQEIDDETLVLCATLESQSTHPLARAIVDAATRRGLQLLPMDEVSGIEQTSGAGIRGIVAGRHLSIGNLSFVKQSVLEVDSQTTSQVSKIAGEGQTPVLIAIDGDVKMVLAIGDSLRTDALTTMEALQQRGWAVGILSGDHPTTVAAIAKRLNLDDAMALGGLSPEQKLQKIEGSRRSKLTTAMVGDGVNDAAALAAADVGIAIRGGAEASLHAAPIYLASGELMGVVQLVDASRATVKVIRRNFRVSLGYNSLAITLAVCGVISPLIAAILMPISSLTILSLTLSSKTFGPAPHGQIPHGQIQGVDAS
jgi:Cu2+-exporting ATPase